MNILIISRHFPPIPSGGARRPYLMAQALKERGHRVFVASPAQLTEFEGLAQPHIMPEPPRDVNPYGIDLSKWSIRQWGRELLRWPDPDSAWTQRLITSIIKTLPFKPDWIITSSPPESLLLAGSKLKKHYKCNWLADFRDCWLEPPRRPERRLWFRRIIESIMAHHLLRSADVIAAVDACVANEISNLAHRPVDVVAQLIPKAKKGKKLTPNQDIHLVYTGQFSIGDPDRHLETLLDTFESARALNDKLRLHICGHLTLNEKENLAKTPCADFITFYGALPLTETLELQASADALIVMSSPNGWAIPGKLFEYRAVGAPIIIIGSGPWRKSAGLDLENDPIADMVQLNNGNKDLRLTNPPIPDPGHDTFIELLKA